ncbi:CoA-transferase [Propionimicrobium sp. PCR01-08-3]|uniref:acyl CoA:acetate/3-ketoacid CoA transferase n=1 Tax=Propionimicrobium sp. PCR01-08-3 TaxID=3052086 RepID=UPI00255D06A2|nr:CoA-transferase [Propionimicrobium sp. PCR01-08-3]WIY83674.1 CoA-transferase [Propionimicrobium sp. PCR01-08-3]
MRCPPVLSAADAAALIPDGATVAVSSASAIGCPDAVLAAIGERFEQTGSPSRITSIHAINSGDMSAGIAGVDHLAKPGLLARIIGGSYPAGPSKMAKPAARELLESGGCQAYMFPSGVVYEMIRAAAAKQPGVFTDVGVGTYFDPRIEGGKMNDVTPDLARIENLDGREWIYVPAIPIDVAIIRATTADPAGNLTFEDEAAVLGTLDAAMAAHNNGGIVIAQVKRTIATKHHPREVHVPGALVDAIVVAPDQQQAGGIFFDPAISGTEIKSLDDIDRVGFDITKVIARRAAMELHHGDLANLGFGISANVPRILMEEGLDGEVTWVIEQGPVGGFPVTGKAFGAAYNPDAIVASSDQFILLQGGGIDIALLSFMEVSGHGDVNVSLMRKATHVTAGVGGFADITAHAKRIVFSGQFTAGRKEVKLGDGRLEIVTDGTIAKFLPEVAQITWSGQVGAQRGQQVLYVTERAVLELRDQVITVVEIAPGVDLERDVLAKAGIPLAVADDLLLMDARIFTDEPMGLELGAPRRAIVLAGKEN